MIFDVLSVNGKQTAQGFLSKDPQDCNDDPFYQELRKAALAVTVVNDFAVRAKLL